MISRFELVIFIFMVCVLQTALEHQRFNWNTEPLRRGFAFFKHLDVHWRIIGHEGVDSNDSGSFRMSNIKRRLYRSSSGIGKAPIKCNMKNILKSEVKGLDKREIRKAIEWLRGRSFSSEDL